MANGSLRICLDPGHSNNVNRGVIPSYYESTMNWVFSHYLKEELLKYENTVVFITKSVLDSNPSLEERGKFAITNNCEVFYSIHSNAASSSAACGVSVFRSVKRPDSVELGVALGQKVVDTMRPDTGITYLRHGGNSTRLYPNTSNLDYYGVIRASVRQDVVKYSFLVEHGFHTNQKECAWLLEDKNLRKMAKAEAEVFAKYFGLKVKETPAPAPQKVVTREKEIKVGDIVEFMGGAHYSNAYTSYASGRPKAGRAKVTRIAKGRKHPYHLVGVNGETSVYGWVDKSQIKVEREEVKPAPQPAPKPTPKPTPAPVVNGEIEVGDIVKFNGGAHYSNAKTSKAAGYPKAGMAKVTRIIKGAKHPYHVIHTDGKSSVYGWVDASSLGVRELKVGDIVEFMGGAHYSNAVTSKAGGYPRAGKAKITGIAKGSKHPYHLVGVNGETSVYGWVDADRIR